MGGHGGSIILLGLGVSYFSWSSALKTVWDKGPNSFEQPLAQANSVIGQANQWKQQFDEEKAKFLKTDEVGKSILQNFQNRDAWLKFMKAVNLCLPRNEGERPKEIVARDEVKIDAFECRWVDKVEDWYAATQQYREADEGKKPAAPPPMDPNAVQDPNAVAEAPPMELDANGMPMAPAGAAPVAGGPTGPGWVFQLRAHHYRNIRQETENQGVQFLRRTLLANLKMDEIPLPKAEQNGTGTATFPVKKLGIAFPVLVGTPNIDWDYRISVEEEVDNPMPGRGPVMKLQPQPRYDFVLQFCWQPFGPPSEGTPPPVSEVVAN